MIFQDDSKVSPSDNLPILIMSPSEMMILSKNENCQKKNPKNILQKKERDPSSDSSPSYQRLPWRLNPNLEFKMNSNSPVHKWDCGPRPPDDWFWNCSDNCVEKEPNIPVFLIESLLNLWKTEKFRTNGRKLRLGKSLRFKVLYCMCWFCQLWENGSGDGIYVV